MKNLLCVFAFLLVLATSHSQTPRYKAEKYPSLLWEITGRGTTRPSYLFGTMHVSSKIVFNLSDSFYLAIRNAEVVALETNPANWQDNFSRYDLDGEERRNVTYSDQRKNAATPQDYLTINSLQLFPYEKSMEAALYSNPSIINSFLYRSDSDNGSDFEEDTYLDLHIFQTGRKLGKRICGVEDFDGSMQLVKEAYHDAAREKRRSRSYNDDDEFSYTHLEEAYRSGNLDLLDTINKVNSQSAAFDEKFLYRRNEIQARSIDSILKTGTTLFVGVGAAHLPGNRGVIEILRSRGYTLRPIRIKERDGRHKENFESLRVPVQFIRQTADDGFYSVSVPGKLYNFSKTGRNPENWQYADMVNGSYYIVTRLATHAALLGQTEAQVLRRLDSVLYENIPGKILVKKPVIRNGYRGFDIVNRTRRGDVQRYEIFVTPFEILLFKMSGNGNYVREGTEAGQFFGSIQLKEQKQAGTSWSPSTGGFAVDLPHLPLVMNGSRQAYAAYDAASKTAVEVFRTGIHNYAFLEEDSFDLELMEESFAASATISRNISRQRINVNGCPALEATYKCNDSSLLKARFIIQGPLYYTLVAAAVTENRFMNRFLQSFTLKPFVYGPASTVTDSLLQYRVQTPVVLAKKQKLQFYGDEDGSADDDSLVDDGTWKSRLVASAETGEKILVSYFKPSAYTSGQQERQTDSARFRKEWVLRKKTTQTLANGLVLTDLELGKQGSSRLLKQRLFTKNGVGYKLITQLDTLTQQSAFIRTFFDSFQPLGTLAGVEGSGKKADLFFSRFFSADTLQHKRAVKNLDKLVFDSADFPKLRQCIESLTWKEAGYLDTKKELLAKLGFLENREASDYLKTVYRQAADTVELQYVALESLLTQQTDYALQTFGQIIETDPPVLDLNNVDGGGDDPAYSGDNLLGSGPAFDSQDGSFLDLLADSLQLSAGIAKNLLPLLNLPDYEQPVREILAGMVDSAFVRPAVYGAYLPGLLMQTKQEVKKQLAREKALAIEKARLAKEEKADNTWEENNNDNGNGRLNDLATLILPFWEQNPQVPLLMNQLLQSSDRRLKYNTALLLLRNGRQVPDSLWATFAALDEYRFRLYTDLKKLNKLALFPAVARSQLQLARSWLVSLQAYNRPDTLVYLQKLPVRQKEIEGVVYFFKYKEKKNDLGWKLAAAGLFPTDSTILLFNDEGLNNEEKTALNFTGWETGRLTTATAEKEQLEKQLKKLLYSHRKSAVEFYSDEGQPADADFLRGR